MDPKCMPEARTTSFNIDVRLHVFISKNKQIPQIKIQKNYIGLALN